VSAATAFAYRQAAPVPMSINFAAKLEQVLGKDRVQLGFLEGAVHGDPQFESPENVKKVLDFIDKQMN
jgi:hypothetical protein